MPPRFVYWTIIAGGMPTAFRAADREDLLPVFHRIRGKHPDAEMKYFAQGKLWNSPEEAREARARQSRDAEGSPPGPRRSAQWRPGGEHRDPRQKFVDQKKARNQRWRQEKFERRPLPRDKPHGDPLRREVRFEPDARTRGRSAGSKPKPAWPKKQGWNQRPDSRPRNVRWNQQREDKPHPGPRPDREPRKGDEDPKRPPRPSEPRIEPPGPPERGARPGAPKRPFFKRGGNDRKGPRKPPPRGNR